MDGKKNKKTKDGRKRPKSQEESRASGRANRDWSSVMSGRVNRDKSSEMQVRPPEQVCFMLDQNRECICRALDERKRLLEQFVQDSWPERSKDSRGSLRVSRCGGTFQYYWREQKEGAWKYLAKHELGKARQKAECEYREKLLESARKELSDLTRRVEAPGMCMVGIRETYESIRPGRRALIEPWILPDEIVRQEFCAEPCAPLETFSENKIHTTSLGENVRSKSEWMIAESLHSFEIPYRYEAPLLLPDGTCVHPDFRCLNVRTRKVFIWEHFGKMGDPEYAASAIRKRALYEAAGYYPGENLIITEECNSNPLVPSTIERQIRRWLV
ncbi:MAG: hypothetical protein II483_08960 [Lachnospiraceae bacterium]|nr:hypothetical protein [Lachnospiraceae bacterium]